MQDQQRIVEDIVAEALELNPEARRDYLARVCGTDADLRREVELLIDRSGERETSTLTLRGLAPLELIGNRWRIVCHIGSGAMGDVYEAHDEAHANRRVALKVIRPEVASDPRMIARFKQEVRIGQEVTNKNICRVYDLGYHVDREGQSLVFMTMELLTGETLSKTLQRHKLSIAEARSIVSQVVEGLAAMHSGGYVHRDLKPSNIMIVERADNSPRVVITDLGLARKAVPGIDAEAAFLENAGRSGTPAYMAPEQVTGGALTQQVDIFALGVIMYEMISGELPFKGKDRIEIAQSRLHEAPPSLRTFVPDLDRRWEDVILTCLQRDPSQRFASVLDIPQQLDQRRRFTLPRWESVGASVLVLAALAGVIFLRESRIPVEKHVVVLPFQNVANDPNERAFTDGLLETSTSMLSELEQFRASLSVTPASEVRQQGIRSVADAVRNFGANLVISGSIQRASNGALVTVNLVDAERRKQLRSVTLTVAQENMASIEQSVTAQIANMLALELNPKEQYPINEVHTSNPAANEAYLKGTGYLRRGDNARSITSAIDQYEAAVKLDPSFSSAYVGLALSYARQYGATKEKKWLNLAQESANKGVALSPHSGPAYAALGSVDLLSGNVEAARDHFQRTLAIDPLNADGYKGLAQCDERLGLLADAEQRYKRSIELRPHDWSLVSSLSVFYADHGRLEQAGATMHQVLAISPNNPIVHRNLGAVYIGLGKFEEAEQELVRSIQIEPTAAAYSNLGVVYIYERRYNEAIPVLEKALALGSKNLARAHTIWLNLGDAYASAPESHEKARNAYQKAIEGLDILLSGDPENADLLSTYASLQAKVGHFDSAAANIAKALQLAPGDAKVRFHASLVYELSGNRERAIAALRDAVEMGYPTKEIERDPALGKLREDNRYLSLGGGNGK